MPDIRLKAFIDQGAEGYRSRVLMFYPDRAEPTEAIGPWESEGEAVIRKDEVIATLKSALIGHDGIDKITHQQINGPWVPADKTDR